MKTKQKEPPYKLWEQHSATDKEIAACKGDYIGCEICRWSKRCAILLIEKLNEKTKELSIIEKTRKETAKEILQCLYDKCYEIQNLRECVAHITPLDILQLAKHYGVEVEE